MSVSPIDWIAVLTWTAVLALLVAAHVSPSLAGAQPFQCREQE